MCTSFQDLPGASAEDQFSTFNGSRSRLVNYLELEMRVRPFLEQELATLSSTDPRVTVQEYFPGLGAVARIAQAVPRLRLESIETLDDFTWAVCSLEPQLAREMLTRTIEDFAAPKPIILGRTPGSLFRAIEVGFATLQAQLGLADSDSASALAPLFGAGGSVRSEAVQKLMPELSSGPASDTMLLGLRNIRWAERNDAHARASRAGLFYVLGAMHLVDYEHFDGLLTLLEKRGITVRAVRRDGPLQPLSRRLSNTSPPTSPNNSPPSTGKHR